MAKVNPGSVIVFGFSGQELPREASDWLSAGDAAGVILFKRNLGSIDRIRGLTASVAQSCPELPPLICVDQEGGRVQRLGAPVTQLPAMRALGVRDRPEETKEIALRLGRQLLDLGFNVDFAPVLDVDTNPDNPVIGDRSFGADPDVVISHALAFERGLKEAGVLGCGKHFPGHGDTHLDSHLALPRLDLPRERLDRIELAPFRAAAEAGFPMIMSAHIIFSCIDGERPATLSRPVIEGLLRQELGFDGVIVSDDLEMKAIADHYPVADAAVEAIDAGCDLLLICHRLDLVRSAREAIAERAKVDARFRQRLERASERIRKLRERLLD